MWSGIWKHSLVLSIFEVKMCILIAIIELDIISFVYDQFESNEGSI